MESPRFKLETQTLSPSSSGRRSSDSNSPEFEFWMVRNPSFPQPDLHSADELFVDGVLLPLHLLRHHHESAEPVQEPKSEATDSEPPVPDTEPEPGPGPEISSAAPASTASKRWKDIFKKGEKKGAKSCEDKDKEKKKERKSGSGATSAELNINIWPFSRSRSAGNNAVRPRMAGGGAGTRKVSSAPCSRSNSAGESKSRKWPSSPGRPGVHVGRSSPVWQVRRGGGGSASKSLEPLVRNAEKGSKKDGSENRRHRTPAAASVPKDRVLNLNVPMCMGYRHHLSCRSDENSAIGVTHSTGSRIGGGGGSSLGNGGGGGGGSGTVGSAGNLFSLRSLFTKKVY